MKSFQKWLSTPLGSWAKVFLAAFLGQLLYAFLHEGVGIFDLNMDMLEKAVTAALVAVLPVIINALNPQDTRYGKGSD